jgi:Uma2 family endonuclease
MASLASPSCSPSSRSRINPALVVELLSPGNRKSEIAHKAAAYLAAGSREVVVMSPNGAVSYHRAEGSHVKSAMGVSLDPPREMFP